MSDPIRQALNNAADIIASWNSPSGWIEQSKVQLWLQDQAENPTGLIEDLSGEYDEIRAAAWGEGFKKGEESEAKRLREAVENERERIAGSLEKMADDNGWALSGTRRVLRDAAFIIRTKAGK